MHLWTEYEGRTIAESYTLGKLLRSEGRNGFFATSDKDGHSAVIRLTEAHFDEEEQLKRWRQVAGVHQDNLIEIEKVGQTTFDGVPLTYALMEPDDANLGDVLKERPLTTTEALQVGKSVLAALAALHGSGLVHEHIAPDNVLAVGETVKLRSDCVRECVADVEFNTPEGCADLRRRDLHDFGLLLLQCLTLEKELTPTTNLPEPFRRFIPRALDGSWTLDQIASVLDPTASMPRPVASANGAATQGQPAPSTNGTGNSATARPLVPPGVRQGTATPGVRQGTATSSAAGSTAAASNVAVSAGAAAANKVSTNGASSAPAPAARLSGPRLNIAPDPRPEPAIPVRTRGRAEQPEPTHGISKGIWIAGLIGVVLLILLAWHLLSGKPAPPATAVVNRPATVAAPAAPTTAPTAATGVQAPVASATEVPAAAVTAPGWYVIAYTYNHEGQAQARAARLGRRRGGLHAQVFSPSGHAPYLVSLGGPMSEADATALLHRARRSGMPRDTFIRRYGK